MAPSNEEDPALDPTLTLSRARQGRVRLKLMVLSGPESGQSHALTRPEYVLGKAPTCDIVLTDKTISREHLKLTVHDEHVVATDMGSRNGSSCDGRRFTELELHPGTVITLGTTELKLVPEESAKRTLLLSNRDRFGALVGNSRRMREVFTLLERLSPGGADVLIQGETGTGKDLCAEAIHQASRRASGPFVIVDLAGVAPSLIESELFGHVKGAFTNAQSDRAGAFERAHNGTVFLDEVGELPLELQPRLLRVLERRQVKRVGANDYVTVNMRVVTATHRDLEDAVRQGKFRRDLYHRLAVLRVTMPSLRERPEDIPLLIDTMLEQTGRPPSTLSDQTRALLTQYPWPGNVRELRNVVEQVVNLGEEALPELEPADSERGHSAADLDLPFKEAKERLVEGFERDYLRNLLERCEGNISRASREADIDRVYLRKLLKKHGIEPSGGA
ncbi:sigma-54 dependent transcriptional regulator, Fis family [Myxococcus xanthus DK 1622]|uniref:Sigma-54 dependent transcriptional regulator, Fis family n=2 Tax=Myxococcus xanthus TaxID=34 RepID=Q1DG24_MYXXD|nr:MULTISPECIES: sigma 54-interacting transcriptional regulator [Myxococcus]ABF87993.1 sigma-54 dependent transcriptional regulator, Fis family [Myxococcus xanthus DK 1622]NOJ54256.1 sigma 54-interacting transcriptional regulator [Myxococcus xanthus]QPM79851.1 sigma 54-interacting transcriptional regulator [Myxococcus xanthus]QVW68915.1 sigma 54-interacting transcriptional regulator [Myxococcus xanthus DZ2]QZZ47677.1 Anaerobic nitric oxide reductase transcription regulator NorR [Myxococcus xan